MTGAQEKQRIFRRQMCFSAKSIWPKALLDAIIASREHGILCYSAPFSLVEGIRDAR